MRIGRWSIHRPRTAIAAWIGFVFVCVTLAAISGTNTLENGAVGESARGYAIMDKHQLWGPPRELAYLHAADTPVPRAAIHDVEGRFRALGLTPEPRLSVDRRSGSWSQRFRRRSRWSAVVPVLLGLSAVAAGLGLLGPLSQLFPVQDSAKTVVLLIGMAVGVDYALFFVVRSRAERSRGVTLDQALDTALCTSGRGVVVSGATVAIALAGMYIVGVRTLSGIATAAIAVVACAVLGAITALPATLRLLGPRIDRGRIPLLPPAQADGGSRFWSALVGRVTRRTAPRRSARDRPAGGTGLPGALAAHRQAE